MGDTTTPSLGLTKMGVGSHRDSWGDVANANLDAIDAGVRAAQDTAAAASAAAGKALPATGGAVTGEITRDQQGAFLHFAAAVLGTGAVFMGPAAGADPRGANPAPGSIWLQY